MYLKYTFDVRASDMRTFSSSSGSLYERIGGQVGISVLLRHFYADVRQHRLIGPVFNERIKDWPRHLARIAEFWARVTGGPSAFSGPVPEKHFGLGLDSQHFGAWLHLWECNCRCYLGEQEAREMTGVAREIGKRLQGILTGRAPAVFRKTP
jgi:hemoglobin